MPILLLFLLVAVFAYLWWERRGSTLTRQCRWRLNRGLGPQTYRCASCGAVCETATGKPPVECKRAG